MLIITYSLFTARFPSNLDIELMVPTKMLPVSDEQGIQMITDYSEFFVSLFSVFSFPIY